MLLWTWRVTLKRAKRRSLRLEFGISSVRIRARTPSILADILRGFLQCFRVSTEIVPLLRQDLPYRLRFTLHQASCIQCVVRASCRLGLLGAVRYFLLDPAADTLRVSCSVPQDISASFCIGRELSSLFLPYLTTLFVEHMNWKGLIRKWPWPNGSTVPVFVSRNWEQLQNSRCPCKESNRVRS